VAAVGDAKEAYLAAYGRLEKELAAEGPPWLAEVRAEAIRRFGALGFPTQKHEEWRHTNPAPLTRLAFRAVEAVPLLPSGLFDVFSLRQEGPELAFINGHLVRASVQGLPPGASVASLAEVLRDDPDAVSGQLGRLVSWEDHPFAALNTAFFRDGAWVHVPRGASARPIHLLHLSVPARPPLAAYPRNVIVLGAGAEATVIESYVSLDGGVALTNAVTEIAVGEDAKLDHYMLQHEAEQAFHVASTQIVQGRASAVHDLRAATGGALARNDVRTRFEGEGGDLRMDGLFAVHGKQHVDFHTRIDHVTPACSSLQIYKGILDGESRGVFNGKTYVRPGAQKTVARQSNKNLLLSEQALVDSTPGLEIRADDVKCSHGSTIGQLDEDAVFYMRARGLEEWVARGILTYAFAMEILAAVGPAGLQRRLREILHTRLPSGAWISDLV